jgi:sporulation protein YlmC with PRC-barrel domain
MALLRELLGRPLVEVDSAETVGHVDHVLVDASTRRVEVLASGKGRRARFVRLEETNGLGTDAVMVRSVHEASTEREQALARGELDVLGLRVLTDQGREIGPLDDLDLDDATGALRALVIDGQPVDASVLLGAGTYAIVVADPWGPNAVPASSAAPAPPPGYGQQQDYGQQPGYDQPPGAGTAQPPPSGPPPSAAPPPGRQGPPPPPSVGA